ncbi:hypothetical protein D3C72_2420150 [compost metagenome]
MIEVSNVAPHFLQCAKLSVKILGDRSIGQHKNLRLLVILSNFPNIGAEHLRAMRLIRKEDDPILGTLPSKDEIDPNIMAI